VKKTIWLSWIILTLALSGFYLYKILVDEDKGELLIGDASYGHFQIELACDSCHTDAFGGEKSMQKACKKCHQAELDVARDTHPKKKFNDPRNADLLQIINAKQCVSCHTEHQGEQTREMGVTLPDDYCFYCHDDVGEERKSHQDLAFDSCATAGCHNFHDNRALYEKFLLKNAGGNWLNDITRIAQANNASMTAAPKEPYHSLAFEDKQKAHPEVQEDWHHSSHAQADVQCGACHSDATQNWLEKPTIEQCTSCHEYETETFKMGKHGMSLAQGLDAVDPHQSSLTFKDGAKAHNQCSSCHKPNEFAPEFAKQEACLSCHSDEHSLAFETSPHAKIKLDPTSDGVSSEEIVTCATCHMPRIEEKGRDGTIIMKVNHNQNDNLRPNEKMIRPVCMQCHSLAFSIDALADDNLILNNFSHPPSYHIPSVDWALKRDKKK
jgi:predicted CXXCH cytochrome family protein